MRSNSTGLPETIDATTKIGVHRFGAHAAAARPEAEVRVYSWGFWCGGEVKEEEEAEEEEEEAKEEEAVC